MRNFGPSNLYTRVLATEPLTLLRRCNLAPIQLDAGCMAHWLVNAWAVIADAGRRQHAQAARQHGRLVRQDVAEDVARHDRIEGLRVADHLHGRIVDVPVAQRKARWVSCNGADRVMLRCRLVNTRRDDSRDSVTAQRVVPRLSFQQDPRPRPNTQQMGRGCAC